MSQEVERRKTHVALHLRAQEAKDFRVLAVRRGLTQGALVASLVAAEIEREQKEAPRV